MYFHKLKPSIVDFVATHGPRYEFLLHPDIRVPAPGPHTQYNTFLPAYPRTGGDHSRAFEIPLEYVDSDEAPSEEVPPNIVYYHTQRCREVEIVQNDYRPDSDEILVLRTQSGQGRMVEYLKVPNHVQQVTKETEDPTIVWSAPTTVTINFYENYVKEQIRTRYAFMHRPTSGVLNPVVDTYFPQLYYNFGNNVHLKTLHKLPTTSVAISPLIANAFNIKQLTCEQMCQVLGFDKKMIRKLITDVKRHKYSFAFVGAGGTSINTATWFSEMCKMVNVSNVFEEVFCFEEDTAEVSNLLRFPIDPRTILSNSPAKLELMEPIVANLAAKYSAVSSYIPREDSNGTLRYPYQLYNGIHGKADNSQVTLRNPKMILYGAPTIETRDDISRFGNFICATHANTNCSIWLNPKQELDNSVESYGMIQLAPFFMNQLRMAIKTLELLAPGNLDLKEQDVHLFGYQFDGTIVGKPDRTYNWQIAQDAVVATEESAIIQEGDA